MKTQNLLTLIIHGKEALLCKKKYILLCTSSYTSQIQVTVDNKRKINFALELEVLNGIIFLWKIEKSYIHISFDHKYTLSSSPTSMHCFHTPLKLLNVICTKC